MSNEYKSWLNKNPLTVWMRRTKTTQMQVAAKLNVSAYAVYLWQHGTSVPKPDTFQKLQKLTHIDDIIQQWAEWKDAFGLQADSRK